MANYPRRFLPHSTTSTNTLYLAHNKSNSPLFSAALKKSNSSSSSQNRSRAFNASSRVQAALHSRKESPSPLSFSLDTISSRIRAIFIAFLPSSTKRIPTSLSPRRKCSGGRLGIDFQTGNPERYGFLRFLAGEKRRFLERASESILTAALSETRYAQGDESDFRFFGREVRERERER